MLLFFVVSPSANALTSQAIAAESGQTNGNAAVCNDPTAAGVSAVVYGESCTPGPKPALTATDFTKSTYAIHTGDAKMLADVTGDGKLDWIVGGRTSETLEAYPFPFDPAVKYPIATASEEFTTDAEAADMDNDGDIDIVSPEGCSASPVRLSKNGGNGQSWSTTTIANFGRTCVKDVEIADFDHNGLRDIALRYSSIVILYQTSLDTYSPVTIQASAAGQEGMDSGDVDNDGDTDLVVMGAWLDNPGTMNGAWGNYPIGTTDATFRATVADFNGDGNNDVAYSCAECGAGGNGTTNALYVYTTTNPRSSWTQSIIGSMDFAHTIEAADFNGDGDMDLMTAQMGGYAGTNYEVRAYDNNGSGVFTQISLPINTNGIHIGRVGDIDGDGDIDFAGMTFTGSNTLNVYMNQTNRTGFLPTSGISPDAGNGPRAASNTTIATAPATGTCNARSLDAWTYKAVDTTRNGTRTLWGLGMGDIDGDGDGDIVAGNKYYRNPGDITGTWASGSGLSNASVVTDIDGDTNKDVIDLGGGISWKEWNGSGFTTVAGPVGPSGAQGYKAAQIIPGGSPEIVYSYTAGNDPAANAVMLASFSGTTITTTQITNQSADEGVGVGDIDGDGLLDIAIGDGTNIAWFKNPGNGAGSWTKYIAGQITHSDGNGGFTDRTEIADVDNDGLADIVTAEETFGVPADTYWFKNPGNGSTGVWTRNLITTQDSTNSMDIADMDDDGDIDVITGEHKGLLRTIVWENKNNGSQWTAHVVDSGKESHLGARVADLDNDGDKEIVSIGYDDPQYLHVWRNNSTPNCTAAPCPALPSAGLGSTDYSTSITGAGNYRVWVRMWAPSNLANSVTLNTQVVGGNTAGCNVTVGDSDTIPANTWTWVSFRGGNPAAPLILPFALGAFNFTIAGREAGVKIDHIVMTQNTGCIPNGIDGANCATGGAISDTQAPAVTVTAPTENETVIGSTTLSANATDDTGVTKVDFLVDGSVVGTDTTLPYTTSWNSTSVPNGAHTVTAKAYDGAQNVTESSVVNIAVNNPPQPPPKQRYLQFNGSQYVNLGNQDVTGSAMTLEAWVKFDSATTCGNTRDCRIISKSTNTNDTATHWQFSTIAVGGNTGLQFKLRANKTVYTVTSNASTNLLPNTWYHVAAVYDNSNQLLYVNGTLVGSSALTGPIVTNSNVPVWLGANPTRNSKGWKGAIDEVRIWRVARSTAQLNAAKDTQLSGSETGLQSYYQLNACSGQAVTDLTGTWNATLGGSTAVESADAIWAPSC